jgi:hypothetical protein
VHDRGTDEQRRGAARRVCFELRRRAGFLQRRQPRRQLLGEFDFDVADIRVGALRTVGIRNLRGQACTLGFAGFVGPVFASSSVSYRWFSPNGGHIDVVALLDVPPSASSLADDPTGSPSGGRLSAALYTLVFLSLANLTISAVRLVAGNRHHPTPLRIVAEIAVGVLSLWYAVRRRHHGVASRARPDLGPPYARRAQVVPAAISTGAEADAAGHKAGPPIDVAPARLLRPGAGHDDPGRRLRGGPVEHGRVSCRTSRPPPVALRAMGCLRRGGLDRCLRVARARAAAGGTTSRRDGSGRRASPSRSFAARGSGAASPRSCCCSASRCRLRRSWGWFSPGSTWQARRVRPRRSGRS